MKKNRDVDWGERAFLQDMALFHLREARNLMVRVKLARPAVDGVRRAMKSLEGAHRHAEGMATRQTRKKGAN